MYGQTLHYWKERKNRWDDRLNDWKSKESTSFAPTRASSTDEEETSMLKSRTEDETSEFAESTARLLESHGIPRKTEVDLSLRMTEVRFFTGNTAYEHTFSSMRVMSGMLVALLDIDVCSYIGTKILQVEISFKICWHSSMKGLIM